MEGGSQGIRRWEGVGERSRLLDFSELWVEAVVVEDKGRVKLCNIPFGKSHVSCSRPQQAHTSTRLFVDPQAHTSVTGSCVPIQVPDNVPASAIAALAGLEVNGINLPTAVTDLLDHADPTSQRRAGLTHAGSSPRLGSSALSAHQPLCPLYPRPSSRRLLCLHSYLLLRDRLDSRAAPPQGMHVHYVLSSDSSLVSAPYEPTHQTPPRPTPAQPSGSPPAPRESSSHSKLRAAERARQFFSRAWTRARVGFEARIAERTDGGGGLKRVGGPGAGDLRHVRVCVEPRALCGGDLERGGAGRNREHRRRRRHAEPPSPATPRSHSFNVQLGDLLVFPPSH
ncbi:hypothetical protein B0H16DRAFT_1691930 [Mycena metata]|uniref:Uncharacterized protein n=1 Tax=Mycena metata TaxID=1033252 RepID=A0AAD7IRS8_9AGAR|nr:hypothetical protein B0H16DRAFT_1691930 [Mycena metata]